MRPYSTLLALTKTVAYNVRKFENKKSISENKELFDKIITPHISDLKSEPINNKQKILELCHLTKFLMFSNSNLRIDQVTEKPDFILSNGNEKIGLEHQVVIDPIAKKREGFFQDIFEKAEKRLQMEKKLPNFLANCYIRPYVNFQTNEKENLITTLETVIHEFVLNGNLIENPIIDEINIMTHSRININPNLGSWWIKDITPDKIEKAIKKKESKINSYKENGVKIQWLLMVIGSNGDSSFNMNENLNFEIKTEFDKVFILEDFNNNLYELK